MKLFIISKKYIIAFLILVVIILGSIIIDLSIYKSSSSFTISPINSSEKFDFDLTGDGQNDSIKMIKNDTTFDLNINYHNSNLLLSSKIDDNVLFDFSNYWSPKIYLCDLSRDIRPEIIMQGTKNKKSVCYLFNWFEGEFYNLYCSDKNIFGILDSKNTKTPECYSLSSSKGVSSINSFMFINNKLLDTTIPNNNIVSLNNVINFINLIELPYELENLPDIFSTSIKSDQLSILWNLDKENYSYSFQDGFFYDYEWTDSGDPKSLNWYLTFEKSKLKGEDNDKSELVLTLNCTLDNSKYFISSIEKNK